MFQGEVTRPHDLELVSVYQGTVKGRITSIVSLGFEAQVTVELGDGTTTWVQLSRNETLRYGTAGRAPSWRSPAPRRRLTESPRSAPRGHRAATTSSAANAQTIVAKSSAGCRPETKAFSNDAREELTPDDGGARAWARARRDHVCAEQVSHRVVAQERGEERRHRRQLRRRAGRPSGGRPRG